MNMKRLKRIYASPLLTYMIVSVIAIIGFAYIYGVHVLNPTYTDWLIKDAHYDLSQHYLGWKAYRNGDWTFPIGNTDYLLYPSKTSVIFTDSIPCLAVLFKLLSPVLPEEFQYFGLWGIMCFILQAVVSAKIISHFTGSRILIILASILFIFSPCMVRKMYGHTALAGQWILLLALYSLFCYKEYTSCKRGYSIWAMLGILTASVHIYFILMCGIVLLGYCLEDIITNKRIMLTIKTLAIYLFCAGCMVFFLGGGEGGINIVADGFRKMSFNLNALFNPQGWSCIYQDLPLYSDGQYEGFSYLGAGGILLLTVSMAAFLICMKKKRMLSRYYSEIAAVSVVMILALITALSPTVTMGNNVLYDFSLPAVIEKYWGAFRATGRVGWILFYILLLGSSIVLSKVFDRRIAIALLSFCVAIQIYDIHNGLVERHNQYKDRVILETVYENKYADFWEPVGSSDIIKHIMFAQPVTGINLYAFADWALEHDKTLNYFYFARQYDDFEGNLEVALEEPDDTQLFLFTEDNKMQCLQHDLNYYLVDDYIVGYTGTFEHWEQLTEDYFAE